VIRSVCHGTTLVEHSVRNPRLGLLRTECVGIVRSPKGSSADPAALPLATPTATRKGKSHLVSKNFQAEKPQGCRGHWPTSALTSHQRRTPRPGEDMTSGPEVLCLLMGSS
jgi:hypothetical protein